jgi:hypothetical protein
MLETHTENLLQLEKTSCLSVTRLPLVHVYRAVLNRNQLDDLKHPFSLHKKNHFCLNQLMECKEIICIYSENQEKNKCDP